MPENNAPDLHAFSTRPSKKTNQKPEIAHPYIRNHFSTLQNDPISCACHARHCRRKRSPARACAVENNIRNRTPRYTPPLNIVRTPQRLEKKTDPTKPSILQGYWKKIPGKKDTPNSVCERPLTRSEGADKCRNGNSDDVLGAASVLDAAPAVTFLQR